MAYTSCANSKFCVLPCRAIPVPNSSHKDRIACTVTEAVLQLSFDMHQKGIAHTCAVLVCGRPAKGRTLVDG